MSTWPSPITDTKAGCERGHEARRDVSPAGRDWLAHPGDMGSPGPGAWSADGAAFGRSAWDVAPLRGGGNRPRLLLTILLVTSLFLITLDLRGISVTKGTRSATQSFLAPIQRGFSDIFSPVGNFISDIKNFGKVKAENSDLKAANAKLKSQVVVEKDVKGQLEKLKGVLDLAGRGNFKVVSARVIGQGSASTFSQTITIDAGSTDGITKDMTVISEAGLVGVVKNVSSSSAIVLLMSDPTFKIGVRIADQGIGMTPEQLGRVFERFYRADASGNIPGTGLGMSLVKEIVELHGGDVEVASEYGKGTTVTLWLPVAEAEHAAAA